jgi:hypothetical protein
MTREDLDKFQKLWTEMLVGCNEQWRTPIIESHSDNDALDCLRYSMRSNGFTVATLSPSAKIPFSQLPPTYVGVDWGYQDAGVKHIGDGIRWHEATDSGIKLHKMLKCECGKEKHGFANHSHWCDMADNSNT